MTIRVLSLNCWGGRVAEPLMQFIKDSDADVYCLQEMYSAPRSVPKELFYTQGKGELPARPQLFREIAELLPDHHAFFCPAAQGYLHDGASSEKYPNMRYGIATFVRETLPVIEQHAGFVFSDYRAFGWGEPPLPRVVHAVRIHDYESDARILVAHMHGLWDPRGKMDTTERNAQAENLLGIVECMTYPIPDKVVVCGDFNVLPDSYTLQLFKERGFVELVTEDGFTDTRTSFYKKRPRYADYMLVSAEIEVRNFDVIVDPEVSDHRPLLVECA